MYIYRKSAITKTDTTKNPNFYFETSKSWAHSYCPDRYHNVRNFHCKFFAIFEIIFYWPLPEQSWGYFLNINFWAYFLNYLYLRNMTLLCRCIRIEWYALYIRIELVLTSVLHASEEYKNTDRLPLLTTLCIFSSSFHNDTIFYMISDILIFLVFDLIPFFFSFSIFFSMLTHTVYPSADTGFDVPTDCSMTIQIALLSAVVFRTRVSDRAW